MALQYPLLPAPQDGSNAPSPIPTWPGCAAPWTAASSDNTRTMYNSAWRPGPGPRPGAPWPCRHPPPLVAAYLAHLAQERALSVATVRLNRAALEVWPESHWPGFTLRQADVLQSYTA